MEKKFYNRKQELTLLKEKYNNFSSGDMVVLYGRRRVGKTELVKQFLEITNYKFYYYVEVSERKVILESLSKSVKEQLNINKEFNDFYEFFDFIDSLVSKQRFVLVIDEFQRFLDVAPEFITHLQNYWDSKFKDKEIMIILLGSSIGMIEKIMNSKAGALYGRAHRIKISPFRYSDLRLMFSEFSEEDKIIIYSIFGGTPYYLDKVKKINGDIYEKIFELVLKKGAVLQEEPKNLLEYENVRVHSKYNSILQAISSGKETLNEIESYTKIPLSTMPAYMNKLDQLLDLVGRRDPILGKERLGRYCLRDNFFRFWYKFIFPNLTSLNLENTKIVNEFIKENLNSYVGRVFEDIIKELLITYNTKEIKGFKLNFENIGSWWNKNGDEIDIVAYNNRDKSVLLGEIKWNTKPVDINIVENLYKKSKLLNYGGTHHFIFVSKSGFTSKAIEKMKEINALHLDLKELQVLFDKF